VSMKFWHCGWAAFFPFLCLCLLCHLAGPQQACLVAARVELRRLARG
jgi:hypothetical protein